MEFTWRSSSRKTRPLRERTPREKLYDEAHKEWVSYNTFPNCLVAAARYQIPFRETYYIVTRAVVEYQWATLIPRRIVPFSKIKDLHLFLQRMLANMDMMWVIPLLEFRDGLLRMYRILHVFGGLEYYLSQWQETGGGSLVNILVRTVGRDGYEKLILNMDTLQTYYFRLPTLGEYSACFGVKRWRQIHKK